MRTALFLLAEFVLFALAMITALVGDLTVLRLLRGGVVPGLAIAGIILLLLAIPYGFYKAGKAVENRRKWGLIIRDAHDEPTAQERDDDASVSEDEKEQKVRENELAQDSPDKDGIRPGGRGRLSILVACSRANNSVNEDTMKFHRFCSPSISPYTEERYGIFVAVWHLVRDQRVTAQEEADYWSHRSWYEANLPLPPCYSEGNPRRAITWFKASAMDHPVLERLSFYRDLAAKYDLEILLESTDSPGEIIYEDEFQVAASRKTSAENHDGSSVF